ncbi:MAG: helix-turn-helix domain-containing protein [Actinobacteria bacterium]|nr:helix-turn-helix domain-containing protein [Actinomycetota bacterium]
MGERLRELRRQRGLTQQQLAEPHYTHAHVSSIEAGRRAPSEDAIKHFARKLGVKADEIRTGRPSNLLEDLEIELQDGRLLISQGEFEEAEKTYRAVLNTAKRYKVVYQQAKALEGLGLLFERSGDLPEATEHYALAAGLLASDPPNVRADAVAGQARCIEISGDKHHAIYLLENLLETLQQQTLQDPDALIRIYTSLAIIYIEGDFLTKAADAAENALQLEEHVNDPARRGAMHNMVARVLLRTGHTQRARESLQKAERFYRLSELQLEIGRARLTRGIYLLRTGARKKASAELTAALETFAQTRSPLDEARAATELGRIAREEGRLEEASKFLDRALERLNGAQPGQVARVLRERALANLPTQKAKIEKGLKEAIRLFEQAEEPVQIAITHAYLGDLLSDRPLGRACKIYREGLAVLERHHVS